MGRWLQVRTDSRGASHGRDCVVREGTPYVLLAASGRLGRRAGAQFPMLQRVALRSPDFVDEEFWLSTEETRELEVEWSRFVAVLERREFIKGLDGGLLFDRWMVEFGEELAERIEWTSKMLADAAQHGHTLRLLL